jgi:hypothetical protein
MKPVKSDGLLNLSYFSYFSFLNVVDAIVPQRRFFCAMNFNHKRQAFYEINFSEFNKLLELDSSTLHFLL